MAGALRNLKNIEDKLETLSIWSHDFLVFFRSCKDLCMVCDAAIIECCAWLAIDDCIVRG